MCGSLIYAVYYIIPVITNAVGLNIVWQFNLSYTDGAKKIMLYIHAVFECMMFSLDFWLPDVVWIISLIPL